MRGEGFFWFELAAGVRWNRVSGGVSGCGRPYVGCKSEGLEPQGVHAISRLGRVWLDVMRYLDWIVSTRLALALVVSFVS